MSNRQTPKSRARKLIKQHMETPGHTLEDLFVKIAAEICDAEWRGYDSGYTDAHDGKMYRQRTPGAVKV